jgi:hypothetical protein
LMILASSAYLSQPVKDVIAFFEISKCVKPIQGLIKY